MSYILEALKKAQAERQLGNAPTIHAPAPSYAAPRAGQGAQWRYLALGVGIVVVAAAVALLWPRFAGEAPVRLAAVTPPAAVAATAPATVPATAPVATPAPPAAVLPAPAPVAQPAPAPVPEARPVRVKPAPAPVVSTASSSPQPSPQQREAAPAPATVAAQPVGDDQLRTLQQLPDTLQREIPKVAFGGYIYSPTPGESLLLVDKMLRREGEEVAPGLVLERLTPKAAVMNYRGTRYRAAY
ncbi:general secretion pathway protein B [Massilia aurea]|uniref:General secretion pathway protein B n=1 Tax=Massilia aurea TaxID=373040 RepID=A0A7W9U5U5_9BURK|nr:general secretion pathway protein GspB [Massilia aurea]MBB6132176.1 general secretion pathway protein B [Massilia aurea]